MAVALRNSQASFTLGTSLVAALPTYQPGDLLLTAFCEAGGGTPSITGTWDAGGGTSNNGPAGQFLQMWLRVAGSSESAPTVSTTVSGRLLAVVMSFSGVLTSGGIVDGLDALGSGAWNASTATYVHPSVTTRAANDAILTLAYGSASGLTFSSGPAGFSQIVAANDGTTSSFIVAMATQASIGASGTISVTYSGTASFGGMTYALLPVPPTAATKRTPPGQIVAEMVQARNAERKDKKDQTQTPAAKHHRISDYHRRRRRA